MNERIDDLMYQAGLTAQGCLDKMDDYDREAILKFAELIVRECADIADKNSPLSFPDHGIKIKQHFGVES